MSYINNDEIVAPVSIKDLQQALGTSENSLGNIILTAPINKWAKYKPVRVAAVGIINDTQRANVNYGIINIPTWININKMAYFWFGINTTSTNYPEIGDKAKYWDYDKPTGGTSSPFRLADFAKNTGIGYYREAEAPIGQLVRSSFVITAGGELSLPFPNGEENEETVELEDLKDPNNSSYGFGNMYLGVMIRINGSTTTWYAATRTEKRSVNKSGGIVINFTTSNKSVAESMNNKTCEVFPFFSSDAIAFTSQLGGYTNNKFVALQEKKSITVSIQYAKMTIAPSTFYVYRTSPSAKTLNYQFSIVNDSYNGSLTASCTVYASNLSNFPSSSTVSATVTLTVAKGQTTSKTGGINLGQVNASFYKYCKIVVSPTSNILFKTDTSDAGNVIDGLPN